MRTFIFGAGASRSFFAPELTTSYLTEKVCSVDEWKRVFDKYKAYNGKNKCLVKVGTIMVVIHTIKEFLPDANFEQIAEVVDKMSSYGLDGIPGHNMQGLTVAVMNTGFLPQNKKPFGAEWSGVPFLLREIIAEAILDLQNAHKAGNYDDLIQKQNAMIKYVMEHDDKVSVMSLNYDDCVLDSLVGLGFEKGFALTDERYLRQLDINKVMGADKVVYFPHGQLKFQFTDNDNVTFWGDSNVANEERWGGIDGVSVGSTLTVLPGKYAYNFNTFISTGQTKDDGLNHMPYAIYYQRLAIDLANSNTVYVIGYSFGDDHVNRLLRSFLKLNPDNRVVIVDFYPMEVYNTQEHRDSNNFITKIYQNLGADWNIWYSQDQGVMAFDQAAVDIINKFGYGELCPQVIFYKKGYSEFLNEFAKVI